jgi:biopolymer transport protein ExbD
MAFGSFDSKGSGGGTMSEINMVPLIDVMLVLLVIFIITAPLLAHSIRINMPQVSAEQIQEEPKTIDLAIDAQGALFWNDQPVAFDALPRRFAADVQAATASGAKQPELRIRADLDTRYETLARVMGVARQAGLGRIAFVTTPPSTQPGAAPGASAGAPNAAGNTAAAPAKGILPPTPQPARH